MNGTKRKTTYSGTKDKNYRPNCEKNDFPPEMLQIQKELHFKKLEDYRINRKTIERDTIQQRGEDNWLTIDLAEPISPQKSVFLKSELENREENPNPLAVWQKFKHGLDTVYDLTMKFLPISATSTSAERLFSHARQISCQLRSGTSPDNIDKRIFLISVPEKYWFHDNKNVYNGNK